MPTPTLHSTSVVSTGDFSLTAVDQISGVGFVTGTSGTLSAGTNNVAQNLEVDSGGSVLFTGNATSWNLNSGSSIGTVLVSNANISIAIAGATQVASVAQQTAGISSSAAQNSASAAAADEAANTFGTDSVAEQIEYGFAGDVGTLPPIDHRSRRRHLGAECFNESREGETC